jgi:hypothetical protein
MSVDSTITLVTYIQAILVSLKHYSYHLSSLLRIFRQVSQAIKSTGRGNRRDTPY